MFDKVLIANRGAIACRIIRTLRRLGVGSVAVYSRADAHARHVELADEALFIGEAPAAESYLRADRILWAAARSGARAVHPGYGFLSENAAFAESCAQSGLVFIGPTPEQMRDFGLKHTARRLARESGAPLLPGSGLLADAAQARREAARIGYPVMLKSTAGGGGIGMQLCRDGQDLERAFASVQRLGEANFSDGGVFLERFVERARHIEVQVFGDGQGQVLALGERDCSLQRRNQKVVEETPAPDLPPRLREQMLDTAVRLMSAVRYRSAGTVEFVYDTEAQACYFLEVNTRLQVEHGVTEEVTGVDLVEWMVRLAAGELPPLAELAPAPRGHSIQARVYAEDPNRGFQPVSGLLTEVVFPAGARVETWVEAGSEVTPYYDPMLAKLIVSGPDRTAALQALDRALAGSRLAGIETNLAYLRQVVADPVFRAGRHTTRHLAGFAYQADTVDVLAPGTHSSVQSYPGRQGHWDVGVPPSGPMDDLALRLGNRLLANPEEAAGLELTVTGPVLRFNCPAVVLVAGAAMRAELDGRPLAPWRPAAVPAGAVLRMGGIDGPGTRAYLCVRGGIRVPEYLGSRATFTLGGFGGHGGRTLQVGDVLPIVPGDSLEGTAEPPPALLPQYSHEWDLRVLYGPHGAPDFFTGADIETFFAAAWEVHYNSSRTGVRLVGPKPAWARPDGGEAGLHPSNIHDNAYAIGAVDFTGDMPVILGPDGPSLGGFVCPAVVIAAERWKLGQLRPGDRVRFVPVARAHALALERARRESIERLTPVRLELPRAAPGSPVLHTLEPEASAVAVSYRQCGDRYLLLEYGPPVLDIALRFRVHALMLRLQERPLPGLKELTPGIRSLQLHHDPQILPAERLLAHLVELEAQLGDIEGLEVPARIVHLPLAWDDSATRRAIDRYMQSVRADAPWCPRNIEFIRRINGLDSEEQVREIVYAASYLVMGLGDVYLGAPVATPLDPRHRLVTTKYNPARTWTPENAVGIGGSYLCVYGMEGPGGYQFVGRTVQMWNRFRRTPEFERPWLLRFFDQVRFFPVTEDELLQIREDFPRGRYRLRIESTTFALRDYRAFLAQNAASIAAFKARQQAAFEAERERWRAAGQADYAHEVELADSPDEELDLPAGLEPVRSHVHGSVWSVEVEVGQRVLPGQVLMVLECMKMEVALHADLAGVVTHLLVKVGAPIAPGQRLLAIAPGEGAA